MPTNELSCNVQPEAKQKLLKHPHSKAQVYKTLMGNGHPVAIRQLQVTLSAAGRKLIKYRLNSKAQVYKALMVNVRPVVV